MSERSDRDVVVHVQWQRSGIALWGVGLALPGESLGELAHVSVENALEAVHPRWGEFFELALVHHVYHALEHSGELGSVEFLVAIGHASVHVIGHHTVVLPHIGNIESSAALGEVAGSVHAHVLDSLVEIAVVNNKSLAQVNFFTCLAQNFVLKESVA